MRNITNAKERSRRYEINEVLENFRGNDEKQYWNDLKRLAGIKKREEVLPEEVRGGDRVERGEKRKEVWNEAFSKLGKFDKEDSNFDKRACEKIIQEVERWEGKGGMRGEEELDKDIEMEELEKALRKAERGKAAGDDGCMNEILKQGGEVMKESLLILFQKMWQGERIPRDWARGVIVPIFKDGEKNNVDNYRGITLLSVVGKLYTRILNTRLSNWFEKEKKIVEEQGGFRAKRSTSEQIFILREIIQARRKKRKRTYCCFLDIRKAYDTVFREGLWKRMIEKGVGGKLWRVVKNLYREVGSCVRLGEEKTDWFGLEVGLRQGCILSPILFSIFIDGLAEEVKKVGGAKYGEIIVSLLLFADDVVLVAEDRKMLKKMLRVAYKYSKKYRFRFNLDKSNVMVFGINKSQQDHNKFYLGEKKLEIVEYYKYLGLLLDKNFGWKAHKAKILDKARKRMKALCGLGLKEGISARAMLRGWQVLVRPILEYGAEIWGEREWKEGENLQLDMGRRVLGVSKMTTKEVIQGELGLGKISSRRRELRLRFWGKIINMKSNRLVYKIYRQRREDFIRGKKKDKNNWCYWTWKFLKDIDLEHLWESERFEPGQNFHNLVRKLIKKRDEDEWRENMRKRSKLRTYRKLKDRLVLEKYVLELEREQRRQLTMLRGGTNKLRIETGRWEGEREEDRVCNVCLSEEVENEKHFLLACPMYASERVEMYERIKEVCELEIDQMNEDSKLQVLIGIGWRNKEKEIRRIVLDYIKKASKIRKKFI